MSAAADAPVKTAGDMSERSIESPLGTAIRPLDRSAAIERMRRRADFLAATRRGRKIAMRSLVLQSRRRGDGEHGERDGVRIGFTVSRKVGNAVERNRVRRRLREAVRLRAGSLIKPGYDYVVVGRRAALATSFAKITSDLEKALGRMHEAAPAKA